MQKQNRKITPVSYNSYKHLLTSVSCSIRGLYKLHKDLLLLISYIFLIFYILFYYELLF